jgi:predicted GNAT family acetyltransferase
MVRVSPAETAWPHPETRPPFRRLTASDAPAMVALAELTEPGPFRLRTLELGNFYGIFHGDALVAMSGKRMHLPGLVEVSGVCTHPDARGRGYAAHLMSIVIDEIDREGEVPFLHAFADNPAVRLYERLGFEVRQRFELAVIRPQD